MKHITKTFREIRTEYRKQNISLLKHKALNLFIALIMGAIFIASSWFLIHWRYPS